MPEVMENCQIRSCRAAWSMPCASTCACVQMHSCQARVGLDTGEVARLSSWPGRVRAALGIGLSTPQTDQHLEQLFSAQAVLGSVSTRHFSFSPQELSASPCGVSGTRTRFKSGGGKMQHRQLIPTLCMLTRLALHSCLELGSHQFLFPGDRLLHAPNCACLTDLCGWPVGHEVAVTKCTQDLQRPRSAPHV